MCIEECLRFRKTASKSRSLLWIEILMNFQLNQEAGVSQCNGLQCDFFFHVTTSSQRDRRQNKTEFRCQWQLTLKNGPGFFGYRGRFFAGTLLLRHIVRLNVTFYTKKSYKTAAVERPFCCTLGATCPIKKRTFSIEMKPTDFLIIFRFI